MASETGTPVYGCETCGAPIIGTSYGAEGCAGLFCSADCLTRMMDRPLVVCLCGSTRFGDAFREANLRETLAGRIVLTIGCDTRSDDALGLGSQDKAKLDLLHLRKIDLADEILVLNVGCYIGESTRREIDYALARGKRIRYLRPPGPPPPRLLHNEVA